MTTTLAGKRVTFPLVLLCIYVLMEYGKPRILAPFHLPLILQVLLVLLFLPNLDRIKLIIGDRYFKLFLILLVLMTIHGPIAANNYSAFMLWRLMVSYLIFSLSFCLFLDHFEKLRIFLTFMITILVLCAVIVIITGGNEYSGRSGFMTDKNDFAMAMNVIIPISFFMALSNKGIKRIGFLMATVLFIVANVSSFSRGGFIGMTFVLLLCFWSMRSKMKAVVILLIVATAFVTFISKEYESELLSITDQNIKSGTGRDRIELWKVAWRIFRANPIIGVGQGNATFIFGDYQVDEEGKSAWGRSISGKAIHSVYFTILAELGIIGMLIWVLMIGDLYRKYRTVKKSLIENQEISIKNDGILFMKNMNLGLSIGLIGYLVSGVFLSAFFYPEFWNVSGLMTALSMSNLRLSGTNRIPAHRSLHLSEWSLRDA